MATLAPTTAILQTAIQSGMTHIDAVSEFVDNSFGPSAGDANEMTIIDAQDGTMFVDQGRGVSDLNLLFRLGDGNSRKSTSDIGRFGVGSKFGALTFGTDVTVMTVHEGKFHQFSVDWGKVLTSGKWPNAYTGEGLSTSKAPKLIKEGGTIIIVKDLHKGRQRPADLTYIKRLGLRFMPALMLGKNIKVYRANSIKQAQEGSIRTTLDIKEAFSKFLSNKVRKQESHTIKVGNKVANCTFGEIPDGDSTLTGVHITYGGRVIKTLDRLGKNRLPSKFFGRVDLGTGWKSSLSYNKTEITEDADLLESAIYEAAENLIKRLTNDEQSKITERLAAEISNMMDKRFGKLLRPTSDGDVDNDEGDDSQTFGDGDEEVVNGDGKKPKGENPNASKDKSGEKDGDKARRSGSFEFNLKPGNYGKQAAACWADLVENGGVVCNVFLNKDIPVVAKAMHGNPGNKPAVVLLSVKAMASYMTRHPTWITRMFKGDVANEVISKEQIEQADDIYNEIMKMIVLEKDENQGE